MKYLVIPLKYLFKEECEHQACINLSNSSIEQDRSIKKRFTINCRREKRKFSFESVLDIDHAEWFQSIKQNIEVILFNKFLIGVMFSV